MMLHELLYFLLGISMGGLVFHYLGWTKGYRDGKQFVNDAKDGKK